MNAQKLRAIAAACSKRPHARTCPACKGRGFTGVETIGSRSLIDCPDCHGEGLQTGANWPQIALRCGTRERQNKLDKAKPKAYAPKPCVESRRHGVRRATTGRYATCSDKVATAGGRGGGTKANGPAVRLSNGKGNYKIPFSEDGIWNYTNTGGFIRKCSEENTKRWKSRGEFRVAKRASVER